MNFSVIIPTIQEEETLWKCVQRVRLIEPKMEIVIADGGSSDATIDIAQRENTIVCCSPRGRGRQLNAGARCSSGEVLLFLHADTLLPLDAVEVLREQFGNEATQVGTFRLTFDVKHPLLALYSFCSRFDSVFTRFGDQCIAVRKSFFQQIGGFPDWSLFEDVQFLRRARARTRVHSFRSEVTTSARRFVAHGILRQQIRNGICLVKYFLGGSPERLALQYEKRGHI